MREGMEARFFHLSHPGWFWHDFCIRVTGGMRSGRDRDPVAHYPSHDPETTG